MVETNLAFQSHSSPPPAYRKRYPTDTDMKKHALTVALVIWPIAVVACYAIARDWLHAEQGIANSAELQKLLGARRYQILIPREMDGYWLTLTPTIDGVAKPSSSGSVRGGSQITLIVQNDLTNDLRYAWVGGGITMMGTCTNP
ncbi:MAG: hypothetical protein ACF787_09675, partial [Rhodopirellula sp. JB053]